MTLHDAKTGQSETLTCTPEHPFFVSGQGWVEAGSLGIGTSIVTRAGPLLCVTALTWQKNKAEELAAGSSGGGLGGYTVYNLTVAGDHAFFVGTAGGGTWVHNVGCGKLINWNRQNAHIIGTPLHAARLKAGEFPSELVHPNPQQLLDNFGDASAVANDVVMTDFGQFIGYSRDQFTGARTATTWGKIHYGKNSLAKIVPTLR